MRAGRGVSRTGIQSIARNGLFLMGSTWVEIALRIVYVLAITRYLGPELYGIWAYTAATYALAVGFASFGFETLIPIRLSDDRAEGGKFVNVSLTLRLGLLGLAALGMVVYALTAEPDATARLALLFAVPALCGRGLAIWARTVFLGFERVGLYVKMAATVRLAEVILGIALLALGADVLAIVLLHSAAWILEAVVGIRMVHSRLTPCRLCFDRHEGFRTLRHGVALGIAALFTNWLIGGPLFLLRHSQSDLATLGQFGLALQVTTAIVGSVQPFLASTLPVLTRSTVRGDPRVAFYGPLTVVGSALIFGLAAILAFEFGPTLISRAFGTEFNTAGALLGPCLLIGGLMLAPTGYGQLLVVRGRRRPTVIASAIGGLVLVFSLPMAVEAWGLLGAVLTTGGAWFARCIVLIGAGMHAQKVFKTVR